MRNSTITELFSVVIPVYNVQDYLTECVESVLKQTFGSYEIILVDDGSTDASGEICDRLAETDRRIKVIHQPNQGLSGARNTGLKAASGEYILFLDSDDFYPQDDFLQKLWDGAQDRDMICFNYVRYTDRLLSPMIAYPDTLPEAVDMLWLELAKRNAYQSSACIKAVKRALILEKEIWFEQGILSEDIEWSARVMRACRSMTVVPDGIYAYRVRQGSISKTVSPRNVADQIKIVSRLSDTLMDAKEPFGMAYNSYVAFQYSALMINGRLSKPKVSREELRKIKKLSWLLRYDANRLVKLIHTVYRFAGFGITSRLLLIYFKLFCK